MPGEALAASKFFEVLAIVLKRVLDPETQERAFKLALKKNNRRAVEISEAMFRTMDLDWIEKYLVIEDKQEAAKWKKFRKNFERARERFFRVNN